MVQIRVVDRGMFFDYAGLLSIAIVPAIDLAVKLYGVRQYDSPPRLTPDPGRGEGKHYLTLSTCACRSHQANSIRSR